jgi:arsenate reductase (glutaredoxin)
VKNVFRKKSIMKVYIYPNCSTCKQALKYLDSEGIAYDVIDISERAPSKSELKKMYEAVDGDVRKLFNTSGKLYREGGYKDTIKTMSSKEVFDLLSSEGMLVKRPFVISESVQFVGFGEAQKVKLKA